MVVWCGILNRNHLLASWRCSDITFKEIASQGKLIGFIRGAAGFWGLLCGRMGTMGSLRSSLFQSFSCYHSVNFCVYAYLLWGRLQAYLNRKNDFTWPGGSNATCRARGLYFALQTMKKIFLLFLCVWYYSVKARIFVWIPDTHDFLKQFCSSNHLFLFSFLSPSAQLMHLHNFRPCPRFILGIYFADSVPHSLSSATLSQGFAGSEDAL